MIRFYLNRELSERLGYKLSRWKRWSREFLAPDPLGGLQSGYARQYSLEEAFQIYLGGHLVADLKLSVPEARKVLIDLKSWVSDQYFSYQPAEERASVQTFVKEYRIYLCVNMDPRPISGPNCYILRRMIDMESSHAKGARVVTERYLETWLNNGGTVPESASLDEMPYWMTAKTLYITKLYQIFIARIEQD